MAASRYTPRRIKKSSCFSCIGGRLCARSCASEVPNPWPIKRRAWWIFVYVSCSTTCVDGPGWSARRTPSGHLSQCGCSSWRLAACRQRGFPTRTMFSRHHIHLSQELYTRPPYGQRVGLSEVRNKHSHLKFSCAFIYVLGQNLCFHYRHTRC